jgi:hypothetical protein
LIDDDDDESRNIERSHIRLRVLVVKVAVRMGRCSPR